MRLALARCAPRRLARARSQVPRRGPPACSEAALRAREQSPRRLDADGGLLCGLRVAAAGPKSPAPPHGPVAYCGRPDVQLWRESKLDSTHEPFWYTADGQQEVRLTDPFDLAVDHDEL